MACSGTDLKLIILGKSRSGRPGVFLKISHNSQENNKVPGLRCFLLNLAKLLKTPFIIEHTWWLLLKVKLRIVENEFFIALFGYCPSVGKFHNWTWNNKINKLQERSMSLVYNDSTYSFTELLEKQSFNNSTPKYVLNFWNFNFKQH